METNAVFTYLVFHHALRIRFKSDLLSDKDKDKDSADASNAHVSAATSGDATPASTDADSETAVDASESDIDSPADVEAGPDVSAAKEAKAEERSANLAGKINNLLTADISTISGCSYLVILRTFIRVSCFKRILA